MLTGGFSSSVALTATGEPYKLSRLLFSNRHESARVRIRTMAAHRQTMIPIKALWGRVSEYIRLRIVQDVQRSTHLVDRGLPSKEKEGANNVSNTVSDKHHSADGYLLGESGHVGRNHRESHRDTGSIGSKKKCPYEPDNLDLACVDEDDSNQPDKLES